MKKVIILIILCFAIMLTGFKYDDTVQAEIDIAKESGIMNAIPSEVKEILESFGINDISAEELSGISFEEIFKLVAENLKSKIKAPFFAVLLACASGILCNVINNFGEGEMKTVYSLVCTLAVASGVMIPLKNAIAYSANVITECSDFMMGFIPIYSSVIAASGSISSATGYRTLMLGTATVISRLASTVIVPLMCVYLALCIAGTMSPVNIGNISKGLKSITVWIMSISAALFSGIMGLGSIVSSSADGVGAKAIKFAVSSSVPVIGGTVSDALSAAKSCLVMTQNVLGAYAIVVAAVIFIPPIINAVIWKICLSAGSIAGDMLENNRLSLLFSAGAAVMGIMLAMLSITAIVFIFSVAIMILSGGGG